MSDATTDVPPLPSGATRAFPAGIPLSALFLCFWIALTALNRIDVTWHFFVGGLVNLLALIALGNWGTSARPRRRRLSAAAVAVSLVISFLLIGAALRQAAVLPLDDEEAYEEFPEAPASTEYL